MGKKWDTGVAPYSGVVARLALLAASIEVKKRIPEVI